MRYATALALGILLSACGAGLVGGASVLPQDAAWRATPTQTAADPAWATARDPIHLPGEAPQPTRAGAAPSPDWPGADAVLPSDADWQPEPNGDLAYVADDRGL